MLGLVQQAHIVGYRGQRCIGHVCKHGHSAPVRLREGVAYGGAGVSRRVRKAAAAQPLVCILARFLPQGKPGPILLRILNSVLLHKLIPLRLYSVIVDKNFPRFRISTVDVSGNMGGHLIPESGHVFVRIYVRFLPVKIVIHNFVVKPPGII